MQKKFLKKLWMSSWLVLILELFLKKILADFHIDKITKNDDIIQMINGIAKGYKPSEIVKQTRGTIKQSSTKASGTKLIKE